MKSTEQIKGVIFDLDGVLVSTDEFHYRAWARLANDENIPFSRKDNQRQRGVSRMESLEVLLERSEREYPDHEKNEMAARKNQYYVESLQKLTPESVLPGVRRLLCELKKSNVKLAVGSSSRNAPLIMKKTELLKYFDAVADGNDITKSKPDPEVFLIAANRLELKPEECLVVEDANAGVEAALKAKMQVLAVGAARHHPAADLRAENLNAVSLKDLTCRSAKENVVGLGLATSD
jgi:beta-phosphoglucomutase